MEYLKTWLRYIVRLPQRAWHWYKGLYRGAPWWKKWLVGLASLLGFFVFYLFAVYVNLFWLFGKSPTIEEIMHPENSLASEIYTEDGVLIGKYFNENRSPVTYKEVAPMFYATLIDTEDERFYSHRGVDIQGLFAAVKDMMHGNARGASTLTQQLVKDAQEAAIAALAPGKTCAEIYQVARKVFEDAGVASAFTHGLGHGVGLETHEAPSLSSRCHTVLEPGMVVTVEPGLYYPEWGGVRREFMLLVTEGGAEIL